MHCTICISFPWWLKIKISVNKLLVSKLKERPERPKPLLQLPRRRLLCRFYFFVSIFSENKNSFQREWFQKYILITCRNEFLECLLCGQLNICAETHVGSTLGSSPVCCISENRHVGTAVPSNKRLSIRDGHVGFRKCFNSKYSRIYIIYAPICGYAHQCTSVTRVAWPSPLSSQWEDADAEESWEDWRWLCGCHMSWLSGGFQQSGAEFAR